MAKLHLTQTNLNLTCNQGFESLASKKK
ncbi:hypothetical protein A2U01_0074103, partial [Trifolium medium]|nr:hypothetical protein [Trifolium medium]